MASAGGEGVGEAEAVLGTVVAWEGEEEEEEPCEAHPKAAKKDPNRPFP